MLRRFLGGLLIASTIGACSPGGTEIVVSGITDQGGRPLTTQVRIFVDGIASQCDPAQPCTIEVPDVPEDGRNVTIEADAGPDYSQVTPRVHQLRAGQQYPLQLNMFRSYDVTVVVEDGSMNPVEGVEVWSEDQLLGITDEFGRYRWTITDKTIREGHLVDIEVASVGIARQSLEPPLRIEAGQYTYERAFSTDTKQDEGLGQERERQPQEPSLALRSSPSGVGVAVRAPSGESFRMVSNGSRRVEPGRYKYTVEDVPTGWEASSLEGEITVGASGTHTIRVGLSELAGTKTLTVSIDPSGGELLLKGNQSGKEYRVRESGTVRVVPDFYSWEVTHAPPGYGIRTSQSLLDLVNVSEETLTISLPLAASVDAYAECTAMYDGERYADAARLCQAVPEPGAGESFSNYSDAQYKLGLIRFAHEATRNLRSAVGHFENVLRYEPQSYNAHFYLGLAHLQAGNLSNAREHFRWIQMNLLLIPTRFRETRNLEALYYLSLCDYRLFEATVDTEQRKRRATDARLAMTNFLRQSEGVSASEIERLRQDAAKKIDFLSGQTN